MNGRRCQDNIRDERRRSFECIELVVRANKCENCVCSLQANIAWGDTRNAKAEVKKRPEEKEDCEVVVHAMLQSVLGFKRRPSAAHHETRTSGRWIGWGLTGQIARQE